MPASTEQLLLSLVSLGSEFLRVMMIYNVKDYGAAGDGVNDDRLAIQAAVNAAHAAGGGEVYIPAGIYAVSGQSSPSLGAILLYDNITVYGDGMGTTTVKLIDGWNKDITGIFRTPTNIENHDVGMHDISIDGNRDNTGGKVDGWFNGVTPGAPGTDTNITLNRVEIMNCSAYGFDPHEQTTNLVITNCISHGNGLDGFTLDYQINAVITDNIAYNNDRHGFNIVTSSHDVVLTDNIAYSNGDNGIIVQRGSDDIPVPTNIIINGGEYYNNVDDGIQINKANYVTVNDAYIHDNGQRAVRIMGSIGSIIENSTLHDNAASKNDGYEEIRLESYDDTAGISGHIYVTSGTQIINNTIYEDGAVRSNYSIREFGAVDYTVISGNVIYGTGSDYPSLVGTHSTFSLPALPPPTTDPNAPSILYAPMLGQSNAELFHLQALDGGSGLSHIESGLAQSGQFDRVITMSNMAVGGSTVDGDRSPNQNPALVWWYPDQNKPGPALLNAVAQMQVQIAALRAEGIVTPAIIWGQGEAEANQLGTSKSDGGRRLAEQEYINSTRLVFNYIQDHIGHDIQFYLMETGIFNTTGAKNFGYPQSTIDKINLGLTYVHDAQIKMALAWDDVHLAVNYSDLPMNADVSPSVPGYKSSWASDAWHLSLDSKEIAADRVANFINLDMGYTHILDDPGPYPHADLADLTIRNVTGVMVNGNDNNNILVGTLNGDTLSGGNGNDIIVGGGGADVMTGGAGSDTFFFHLAVLQNSQTVTITDFQTESGGDVVDVGALLWGTGYTGTNAFGAGYITITQQGADTAILFDRDGTGNLYTALTLALLSGISAGQFNTTSNLVTLFSPGNILAVNTDPSPWVKDDNVSGIMNQTVQGNVLLNNGNGVDSDPRGDTLSTLAATVTSSHGGSAAIDAAGNFVYTPVADYYGNDSFTYTLLDNHGARSVGTVTVSLGIPAGTFMGTDGDNAINGGSRNDIIKGLGGNDTLNGGGGNDTLYAGSGNDTLNGNAGDDVLYANSGNNTLHGNDGNDTLYAGSGIDLLYGDNGNDILAAATGGVTMTGGGGADIFKFSAISGISATITDFRSSVNDKVDITLTGYNAPTSNIADYVRATSQGTNTVLSVDQDGIANGTNFVNLALLQGTKFDVAAMLASGNLVISNAPPPPVNQAPIAQDDSYSLIWNQQFQGNVLLNNGHGTDTDPEGDALGVNPFTGMTTAGGTLNLHADGTFTYTPAASFTGSDSFTYTLSDGHGNTDTAIATLSVTYPPGTYIGTNGDDFLTGGSMNDNMQGLSGNDTISGGGGNDTIHGNIGNDNLNGNSGDDTLYGDEGNDIIHGNDGNDTLYAGSEVDALYGDNGNDILIAATGIAAMTGGGGADTFRFTATDAVSTVTDFRTSVGDVLDVSNLLQAYDPATQAIGDFLHGTWQGSNTLLSVDTNGQTDGAHFTDIALIQGVHLDIDALIASGNLVV